MVRLGRWVSAVAAVVALATVITACASPTAAPPATVSTQTATTSTAPSLGTPSSRAPATSTATDPGDQLPGDLTPNVVEDECLLTPDEFGALAGRGAIRAENTELAGGGARRSCFYAPATADDPAARIDIYASQSLPPPELVARIGANGGHPLPGVGQGAAVIAGQDGSAELVVASATLLAVLTVLPAGAATPPSDQAWTAAGTAMASRLPR